MSTYATGAYRSCFAFCSTLPFCGSCLLSACLNQTVVLDVVRVDNLLLVFCIVDRVIHLARDRISRWKGT